jgi:hypothetical protein
MKILLQMSVYILMFTSSIAEADIYKRVDETGRITYSNIKTTGSIRLEISPEENNIKNDKPKSVVKPSLAKQTSTPESFPRVDKQTQNQRDDKRKEILQSELEAEKQALVEAQQAYAEGESNPEIYRKKNADGSTSTFRNVPKFNAKMESLRADVESHQNNIQLLQKEINALH